VNAVTHGTQSANISAGTNVLRRIIARGTTIRAQIRSSGPWAQTMTSVRWNGAMALCGVLSLMMADTAEPQAQTERWSRQIGSASTGAFVASATASMLQGMFGNAMRREALESLGNIAIHAGYTATALQLVAADLQLFHELSEDPDSSSARIAAIQAAGNSLSAIGFILGMPWMEFVAMVLVVGAAIEGADLSFLHENTTHLLFTNLLARVRDTSCPRDAFTDVDEAVRGVLDAAAAWPAGVSFTEEIAVPIEQGIKARMRDRLFLDEATINALVAVVRSSDRII
jgi:hypothetical protein